LQRIDFAWVFYFGVILCAPKKINRNQLLGDLCVKLSAERHLSLPNRDLSDSAASASGQRYGGRY